MFLLLFIVGISNPLPSSFSYYLAIYLAIPVFGDRVQVLKSVLERGIKFYDVFLLELNDLKETLATYA